MCMSIGGGSLAKSPCFQIPHDEKPEFSKLLLVPVGAEKENPEDRATLLNEQCPQEQAESPPKQTDQAILDECDEKEAGKNRRTTRRTRKETMLMKKKNP